MKVDAKTKKIQARKKKRAERRFFEKFANALPELENKMELRLPPDGVFDEGKLLSQSERERVGERLRKSDPQVAHINEMFVATEKAFSDTEKIEKLREKIVSEYTGTVFMNKLPPNPGPRGRYGEAYIPLKENAQPTWQRPFGMQGVKEEAYKKIVDEWIAEDLIERPKARGIEWCSAGFPVPKKSETFPWRGVVDVRGPNSQTKKCNYPLPLIEDVLVKQGGCHIFSKIDLKKAFHQQPLKEESRPITCTHTPYGIFQWKVNVMGLKNAPIQFQQMMDDLLGEVKDICNVYLDDIIVGSKKN